MAARPEHFNPENSPRERTLFRRLKQAFNPAGFEPLLYLALLATGLTGTALALFLGKLFAAAILGAVSVGIFLRFKRGRVRKDGEQ